ncbi:T9SS type A sorting domain-containing protein, partial [Acinetobacter baumannii]
MDELKPNPASNIVVVNAVAADVQSVNVSVTDMLGRVVLTQEWTLNPGLNGTQLDISSLSAGTYSVTVRSANGNFTKKLAVTK